jgi:hypothetical protein
MKQRERAVFTMKGMKSMKERQETEDFRMGAKGHHFGSPRESNRSASSPSCSSCSSWFILIGFLTCVVSWAQPLPPNIETFTIRVRSDGQREVPFFVRIPKAYDAKDKARVHRVLFICPVISGDGVAAMGKEPELLRLADERGWFVMSASFKRSGKDVHDRKTMYYYPETFSGRAVLAALEQVAKKYPIDTNRLFLQGLSGGAQFVHRFAIWAPERVAAVAVNSSSWFDAPNAKSNQMAWLITIGESDRSFNNTLAFVDQLREVGAAPLFRSYLGMVHEDSEPARRLNAAFLAFYDDLTKSELGRRPASITRPDELKALAGEAMAFVGDSQDWKHWENTPENRDMIVEDSRVYLPSEEIARLWSSEE